MKDNVRYYEIGGIVVRVESDLPITDKTFHEKFEAFRVYEPGADVVTIRHHFEMPDPIPGMAGSEHPKLVYRRPPWAIYRTGSSWVYLGIAVEDDDDSIHRVALFDVDHSRGDIYNVGIYKEAWLQGRQTSLTMFPSDQILLVRLLADREGCLLHSGALTIDGGGLVFVGHSEAGKSTTMGLVQRELAGRVRVLCDDRNIVRRWPEGFRVHGTWSHGDVTEVSPTPAPLGAVLFLEQHQSNEIAPLSDPLQVWQRLLATLVKPLVTAEWWNKEMDVLDRLVAEVPCYTMRFDRSGAIVRELERLVG